MLYEYQVFFAVCGIVVALIRYFFYFRAIFAKQVVPHVFSWFVWGLLSAIVAVAQVIAGAGPSAWVTALMAASCFIVALVGLRNGTKYITTIDWISFVGALAAIGLWILTDNPLTAVIIATVADMLGYIPTWRKAYVKPLEESAGGFALAGSRSAFGLLALAAFNPTTVIHPLFVLLADYITAALIYIRQRQLKR